MGYTRRKMKTSRRVKRTKTKNTRKQKRKQSRAFRKSRRVNRGGSGKGKSRGKAKSRGMSEYKMEDEAEIAKENSEEDGVAKLINLFQDRETAQENSERDAIDREKSYKTKDKIKKNIDLGLYREPLREEDLDDEEIIKVNQRRALANTKNQQRFMDELDAEDENNGLWFGGKKKRTIKKK